jgi:hypothetical protein
MQATPHSGHTNATYKKQSARLPQSYRCTHPRSVFPLCPQSVFPLCAQSVFPLCAQSVFPLWLQTVQLRCVTQRSQRTFNALTHADAYCVRRATAGTECSGFPRTLNILHYRNNERHSSCPRYTSSVLVLRQLHEVTVVRSGGLHNFIPVPVVACL